MAFVDYYEVLEVSPNASLEVIEAAYKRLAQKYHPDRNVGDSDAARRMTEINHARDVLTDPTLRHQHDEDRLKESRASHKEGNRHQSKVPRDEPHERAQPQSIICECGRRANLFCRRCNKAICNESRCPLLSEPAERFFGSGTWKQSVARACAWLGPTAEDVVRLTAAAHGIRSLDAFICFECASGFCRGVDAALKPLYREAIAEGRSCRRCGIQRIGLFQLNEAIGRCDICGAAICDGHGKRCQSCFRLACTEHADATVDGHVCSKCYAARQRSRFLDTVFAVILGVPIGLVVGMIVAVVAWIAVAILTWSRSTAGIVSLLTWFGVSTSVPVASAIHASRELTANENRDKWDLAIDFSFGAISWAALTGGLVSLCMGWTGWWGSIVLLCMTLVAFAIAKHDGAVAALVGRREMFVIGIVATSTTILLVLGSLVVNVGQNRSDHGSSNLAMQTAPDRSDPKPNAPVSQSERIVKREQPSRPPNVARSPAPAERIDSSELKSKDKDWVRDVLLTYDTDAPDGRSHRWNRAPKVWIGSANIAQKKAVESALRELNGALSTTALRLELSESVEMSHIQVEFATSNRFPNVGKSYGFNGIKPMQCCFQNVCIKSGELTRSLCLVSIDDTTDQKLKFLTLRALAGSLGLWGNSAEFEDSIFYLSRANQSSLLTVLSPRDRKLIQFLYKELMPGDGLSQIEARLLGNPGQGLRNREPGERTQRQSTGVLVLRTTYPIRKGAHVRIEVDGKQVAIWEVGSKQVKMDLPAGTRHVTVRSTYRRKDRLIKYHVVDIKPSVTTTVDVEP